jgi:hypothetical protein
MRSIRFCFPTLRQRAPAPCSASSSAFTDFPPAGHFPGCRPERLEKGTFHDAPAASAGHMSCVEGVSPPQVIHLAPMLLFREASWARARATEPLTSPSRSSLRYRCAHFRGARGPIRRRPPRPLLPRCREASRFFPVRDAFHRQGVRCSSSAFRPVIAHPTPGSRPLRRFRASRPELSPGRPAWCAPPSGCGSSTLRHLRLSLPRFASQQGASYEDAPPSAGEREPRTIGTSEGQTPVCLKSPGPFGPLRWRERLLWVEPPVDFCNETTTYEHDPRDRLRARLEITSLLRGR